MQEIIEKINHLDYELKERFDSVIITENNINTGFYFHIEANKTINGKTYQLVTEMKKNDLLKNVIHWNYLTNPADINSSRIDRSSLLENLANDMEDIIDKKRFNSKYLESITENLISINESKTEEPENKILNNINNILVYHDAAYFSELSKEYSYNENVDIFIKTPYKVKFELKNQLKESTKLLIEQEILKLDHVDYIIFKREDNTVEISVTE